MSICRLHRGTELNLKKIFGRAHNDCLIVSHIHISNISWHAAACEITNISTRVRRTVVERAARSWEISFSSPRQSGLTCVQEIEIISLSIDIELSRDCDSGEKYLLDGLGVLTCWLASSRDLRDTPSGRGKYEEIEEIIVKKSIPGAQHNFHGPIELANAFKRAHQKIINN